MDKLYPIKDWTDMHNINEMAPASTDDLSQGQTESSINNDDDNGNQYQNK